MTTRSINPWAPATTARVFESKVEGLRGIAAGIVGLSHILILPVIDPAWRPSPYLRFFESGHGAVLIFFMLSGYVIGLTNQSPFSNQGVREYLRRRSLRLLPIYLAAWLFTLAMSQDRGLRSVFGSLFFLQNIDPYFGFLVLPLHMNGPMWSLNHEAVYYLTFLLLWWRQPPLGVHLAAALLLGIAGWCIPGFPIFISSYACGWIFWSLGWWLSRQSHSETAAPSRVPLLSGLFLLLATHHFASGMIFLNGLHVPHGERLGMVNISNLSLLPVCMLCLIGVTDRVVRGRSLILLMAFAIPLATTGLLLITGRLHENDRWVAAAVFTGVACLLFRFRHQEWLSWFGSFGSISYGFYLIHFPMMFVVQRLPLPAGTAASFALRALVWAGLSVGIAWILERRLQPWVRLRFSPAKPAPV